MSKNNEIWGKPVGLIIENWPMVAADLMIRSCRTKMKIQIFLVLATFSYGANLDVEYNV